MIPGDLVCITKAYELYIKRSNPFISATLENRLAKIEEIIDWESEKGKIIKEARLKTGKWEKLPLEDNKYILSVYYPELIGRKGEKGVIERGVPFFSKDPVTGAPFFFKLPDWMFKEIALKCQEMQISWKNPSDPKKDVP
jgi:hypothetical protein